MDHADREDHLEAEGGAPTVRRVPALQQLAQVIALLPNPAVDETERMAAEDPTVIAMVVAGDGVIKTPPSNIE